MLALIVGAAAAHAGPVMRCPDGTFREAPCPTTGVPTPTSSRVSPSSLSCDPAQPGYSECRRAMDGLAAKRQREQRTQAKRQELDADRKRAGQHYHRITGNCEFLQGSLERSECQRNKNNKSIHNKNFRDMAEADRKTKRAARGAANRAALEAQERKRAAAHAATMQRLQAQQK